MRILKRQLIFSSAVSNAKVSNIFQFPSILIYAAVRVLSSHHLWIISCFLYLLSSGRVDTRTWWSGLIAPHGRTGGRKPPSIPFLVPVVLIQRRWKFSGVPWQAKNRISYDMTVWKISSLFFLKKVINFICMYVCVRAHKCECICRCECVCKWILQVAVCVHVHMWRPEVKLGCHSLVAVYVALWWGSLAGPRLTNQTRLSGQWA